MTKDFKKQAVAENVFGQYGVGWMAGGIAIGLLVGAGMYALAQKGNLPAQPETTAQNPATVTEVASTAVGTDNQTQTTQPDNAATLQDVSAPASEPPSDEIPGFSYHAVLPQLEIDVPLSVQAEQQAAAQLASDKKKDKKEPAADAKKEQDKKTTDAAVSKETDKQADSKPAPAPAVPTGFNGFQIGSYKTAEQAADMQNRLKRNGLNTRVEQANVNGAVWFRVRIGPASSPELMQKWQQTLSGMGISPMAVRM